VRSPREGQLLPGPHLKQLPQDAGQVRVARTYLYEVMMENKPVDAKIYADIEGEQM